MAIKKKSRARKSDEEIMWGSEPEWKNHKITSSYNSDVSKALTWYRNVSSNSDKKRWMIKYAEENLSAEIAEIAKEIPENKCITYGAFARIIQNGFQAKDADINNLKDKITSLAGRVVLTDKTEKNIVNKKPADMIKDEKLSPFYTSYDLYLDGVNNKLMPQDQKLTKAEYNELQKHYESELNDIKENRGDYIDSNKLIERLDIILNDIKTLIKINTITKSRKKKNVTKDKQVSKVNYMSDHSEYGLVSINPENIIGAKTLLLFNTKNRQIQLYQSETGLTVKGSTLKDFTDNSYGKTIRNPEATLIQLTTEKKSVKLIGEIKAVSKPLTGRINKDIIILKAW